MGFVYVIGIWFHIHDHRMTLTTDDPEHMEEDEETNTGAGPDAPTTKTVPPWVNLEYAVGTFFPHGAPFPSSVPRTGLVVACQCLRI